VCQKKEANKRDNERREADPAYRASRNSHTRKTGENPPCSICLVPLPGANNKSGICRRNPKCKKVWKRLHDARYQKRKTAGVTKVKTYPKRPWELYDDGIVDQIAIGIAVSGIRRVRLSPPEQIEVVTRMMRYDYGTAEIAQHMGIGPGRLAEILDGMGFEVIIDPTQSGAQYQGRRMIARKDRPQKQGALDDLPLLSQNPGTR
jgi:hypothetical protein